MLRRCPSLPKHNLHRNRRFRRIRKCKLRRGHNNREVVPESRTTRENSRESARLADSSWIPGETGNLVDEVPTSRDEYGSKSVLSRPYGLPNSVKMCDYMGESVCFLSPHNYKVEARIGVNSSAQHELLTALTREQARI